MEKLMAGNLRRNPEEQESRVIEAAAKCVAETSLLDFTMAAISKEADMSMGSVYKHVQSKEDVLIALAVELLGHQRRVFSEIMALPLSLPERFVACVLLSPERLYRYPFGVHLQMLTGNLAVVSRASSRWIDRLRQAGDSVDSTFSNVLIEAWESGELVVEQEDRDEILSRISIEMWSMSVGFIHVNYQRHALRLSSGGHELPFPISLDHFIVDSTLALLNAHNWRTPLDAEGVKKASDLLEKGGYR